MKKLLFAIMLTLCVNIIAISQKRIHAVVVEQKLNALSADIKFSAQINEDDEDAELELELKLAEYSTSPTFNYRHYHGEVGESCICVIKTEAHMGRYMATQYGVGIAKSNILANEKAKEYLVRNFGDVSLKNAKVVVEKTFKSLIVKEQQHIVFAYVTKSESDGRSKHPSFDYGIYPGDRDDCFRALVEDMKNKEKNLVDGYTKKQIWSIEVVSFDWNRNNEPYLCIIKILAEKTFFTEKYQWYISGFGNNPQEARQRAIKVMKDLYGDYQYEIVKELNFISVLK